MQAGYRAEIETRIKRLYTWLFKTVLQNLTGDRDVEEGPRGLVSFYGFLPNIGSTCARHARVT